MAYTGYRITKYIDVNPNSPTFQQTREERTLDTTNCANGSANWVEMTTYCEVTDSGKTGYLCTVETDIGEGSATYGQSRTTKTYNLSECPLNDVSPSRIIDEYKSYCEVTTFPSGVSGQTGNYIIYIRDENPYSPTYDVVTESSITESDWTEEMQEAYGDFPCEGVDTEPQIEPISESCVMVTCSGTSTTNGQKKVFGLDKNIYSSTYLETVETIVVDTATCPDNCGTTPTPSYAYVFTWSDSTSAKTMNVGYSAQTVIVGLVSTRDGFTQGYTVESGTATTTSSAISLQLTENTSTSSTKTTSIRLKQNDSNKIIMLDIIQAKKNVCEPSVETYYTVVWSGTNPSRVPASATSTILDWQAIMTLTSISADCTSTVENYNVPSSMIMHFDPNTATTENVINGRYRWSGHHDASGNSIDIYWTVTQEAAVNPSDYTFTWENGSTTLNKYGYRMTSGGANYKLVSKSGDTTVGYSIESTEGWEGVTDVNYLPRTGSSSSLGTYLYGGHPMNETASDKLYKVTLVQNGSGKKIYLNMTVQRKGASEDFFFEDTSATTISPTFTTSYPSTGYSQSIISHHNNTNTAFTWTSDVNWLNLVNDGYNSTNDYYTVHYYPTSTPSQQRSGIITLSQNSTNEKLYINVTQQGSGCTTSSTICYASATNVTANDVLGTQTANTVTWNWIGTRTVTTTACTTVQETINGTSSTTVTFSENYDENRTVSGTIQWNVPTCGGGNVIEIPYEFEQTRACHTSATTCYTNVTNIAVTADTVPAAATSNTLTWDWSGTRIVTNSDCTTSTAATSGSRETNLQFPMNTSDSAITVSGTSLWYVTRCDGTTAPFELPYSFTQKSARENQVIINWRSNWSEIVNVSRLIIVYQGSTKKYYYTVNSGPIYQGSISSSRVNVTFSTSKRMSYMQVQYTVNGQSGTRTHYVKLPSTSTAETNPKFTFGSDYFQGGQETTMMVSEY